ncbi:unnamed protein product, partial [Musa banksii]
MEEGILLRAGIKACNKRTNRSLWFSVYFWEETLRPLVYSIYEEVHRVLLHLPCPFVSPFLVWFCPTCRPFGASLSRTLIFLG